LPVIVFDPVKLIDVIGISFKATMSPVTVFCPPKVICVRSGVLRADMFPLTVLCRCPKLEIVKAVTPEGMPVSVPLKQFLVVKIANLLPCWLA